MVCKWQLWWLRWRRRRRRWRRRGGDGAGWRAASAAAWASGTKHPAPQGRITRPFTAGFERGVAITSYARLQVAAMRLAQRHAGVGVAAALRIVLVVVHCSTCFSARGTVDFRAQQPQEGYTGGGQPKASQGEGWPADKVGCRLEAGRARGGRGHGPAQGRARAARPLRRRG